MDSAKSGDTVRVHYTGKFEDGAVFDSSEGRDPLQVEIGKGQVIGGFEQALIGMAPGERKTVQIPPEEGYGPRREELQFDVERGRFPEDLELAVGQRMEIRQMEDHSIIAEVMEITEDTVTLDANHPLAGREIVFDLELVEIV